MIHSVKIVNNIGESIYLDIKKPEETGFLVSGITGLNPPKADISQSNVNFFDGTVVGNVRVGPRNIVMVIVFYEDNNEKLTIEDLRYKCYRYFPVKGNITFYVTNDNGTYKIKGTVEANEVTIFTKQEGAQISILCPDPYFSKESSDVDTIVSTIVPNFHFPCSFEFTGQRMEGYEKFEGPFVMVPSSSEQILSTAMTYSYGDILIAKYSMDTLYDEEGEYYYAEIKADDSYDDQTPPDKDDVKLTHYIGPATFTPASSEQYVALEDKYTENDITLNPIPYERVRNTTEGTLENYTIIIGGNGNG